MVEEAEVVEHAIKDGCRHSYDRRRHAQHLTEVRATAIAHTQLEETIAAQAWSEKR